MGCRAGIPSDMPSWGDWGAGGPDTIENRLARGVTVARLTLDQLVQVRILASQPSTGRAGADPPAGHLSAKLVGADEAFRSTVEDE